MARKRAPKKLPSEVTDRLREIAGYLRLERKGQIIWSEVLSADERQTLGEDYPLTKMTQAYARLRGCTLERSAVDLALETSVIDGGRHQRLRRAIGEPVEADVQPKPVWDRDTGTLTYRGKIIRKVRSGATNICLILDAFQDQRWPLRVDNPLPGGPDSKKLRETLKTLNKGLKAIKFFADGTARGVLWQERRTPARRPRIRA